MCFKFLLFGLLVVALLAACDIQIEGLPDHPERIVTGPGRIEPMVHSPRHSTGLSSRGDTIRYVSYDYIVSGEYAHPDTRDNRLIFDSHFCDHLPASGLDTINLLTVNYFAECEITNNDTLAKNPRQYDLHSTAFDRLRSYRLENGKLDRVQEVFNYQQHAQIVEWEYELYCLPNAVTGF